MLSTKWCPIWERLQEICQNLELGSVSDMKSYLEGIELDTRNLDTGRDGIGPILYLWEGCRLSPCILGIMILPPVDIILKPMKTFFLENLEERMHQCLRVYIIYIYGEKYCICIMQWVLVY